MTFHLNTVCFSWFDVCLENSPVRSSPAPCERWGFWRVDRLSEMSWEPQRPGKVAVRNHFAQSCVSQLSKARVSHQTTQLAEVIGEGEFEVEARDCWS